jgi:hypothetical protein
MQNHKAVLTVAYENLKKEFDRISFLLTPTIEQHPLGEFAAPIASQLGSFQGVIGGVLADIQSALEADDLQRGWELYTGLKTTQMPILANELLAVIGGMYLMNQRLDDVRRQALHDDDEDEELLDAGTTLSFSREATALVHDLAYRITKPWSSVLIVGEERLGYLEGQIIRLRFPACDLWNLPFTAHEYGHLVALFYAPAGFKTLKKKIKDEINPSSQDQGRPPEDDSGFLPEIRQLWAAYRDGLLQPDQAKLSELAERQEGILCRLFADAFATYLVGPAYVHALLHLRFVPDAGLYNAVGAVPSFCHRLVFALETLRWMNQEATLRRHLQRSLLGFTPPFTREVAEEVGAIPLRWKLAVESAGEQDRYKQIVDECRPWLEDIHAALAEDYAARPLAGLQTYRDWRRAQRLEQALTSPQIAVPQRPSKWSVINAAWSARVEQGEGKVPVIEQNALRLLDITDRGVIVPKVQMRSRGVESSTETSEPQNPERARDIQSVQQALFDLREFDLVTKFLSDLMAGNPQMDPGIFQALKSIKSDRSAMQSYARLYSIR